MKGTGLALALPLLQLNLNFNRIEEIAKKRGISMAQVALAWSLSKDFISAPIVGTTSLQNLEDLIGKSMS